MSDCMLLSLLWGVTNEVTFCVVADMAKIVLALTCFHCAEEQRHQSELQRTRCGHAFDSSSIYVFAFSFVLKKKRKKNLHPKEEKLLKKYLCSCGPGRTFAHTYSQPQPPFYFYIPYLKSRLLSALEWNAGTGHESCPAVFSNMDRNPVRPWITVQLIGFYLIKYQYNSRCRSPSMTN